MGDDVAYGATRHGYADVAMGRRDMGMRRRWQHARTDKAPQDVPAAPSHAPGLAFMASAVHLYGFGRRLLAPSSPRVKGRPR